MSILSNPTEGEAARAASIMPMAKPRSLPAGPRKVAPMHPGEVIADILDEQRVSMRAAAIAIGVSPSGLEKVLKGKGPVTPEMALRIEALMGGETPEHWLTMQASHDLWHARAKLADALAKIEPLPNSHPAPKRAKA
ncbi:MAG TPA: HigA family addiction module antitoxin [Xanthobacteraceae bacterium]|nr:HigA family addiction module antitoxin [Xanthobacteraceae bacterium]